MDIILQKKDIINQSFIKKYKNIVYDKSMDTNCHVTRDLLLHLFDCTKCNQDNSNFQTIYIEYKGFGHSCCVYNGKLLQSFENYHYLIETELKIPLDKLMNDLLNHINLFFPKDFIDINKEIKLYATIKYYSTNANNEKIKNNLHKLLKK